MEAHRHRAQWAGPFQGRGWVVEGARAADQLGHCLQVGGLQVDGLWVCHSPVDLLATDREDVPAVDPVGLRVVPAADPELDPAADPEAGPAADPEVGPVADPAHRVGHREVGPEADPARRAAHREVGPWVDDREAGRRRRVSCRCRQVCCRCHQACCRRGNSRTGLQWLRLAHPYADRGCQRRDVCHSLAVLRFGSRDPDRGRRGCFGVGTAPST